MIEIIALVLLWKEMGAVLRKKGRKPLFMQLAVIIGWLGSMIFASICFRIYVAYAKGPDAARDVGFSVYPWMLLAAALTEGLLFGIAHFLSKKESAAVAKMLADYENEHNQSAKPTQASGPQV